MSYYSDTPSVDDELESLGWYHFDLSRHAAEALLLSNGKDGSYLLRNSHEGPGSFALSVRAKDSVKHFHVTRKSSGYAFGFNEFASLQDFVSHFANQPLLGSETGTLIVLKCPYPWRVEEPSIYESVRVHTAMQTGRTESDLVANAPSFGTKEGYLVKLGAVVKNWKQRWFTLNRNELKYFKDKMRDHRNDPGLAGDWLVQSLSFQDLHLHPGYGGSAAVGSVPLCPALWSLCLANSVLKATTVTDCQQRSNF
ncbi:dual adapter for phosphotyrosine and 3-phosphotyrosine and 3-phosphoinositide isoform X1 [Salvelinus namaycush]|uniref:Dual adapter for phosphotyrosine and 3-phosphotyrosine and 3-phosphoinositide isoform X1 n=1 Tax=Salvelinus namaycush TaxID=8040 RepID=A0A8U1EX31_SALNM|nr:dual adapter for phosphotyrosine and 3-phosphotyrosine and 3-phosphoinositide isoform X1 [Salvelinus namaycush]